MSVGPRDSCSELSARPDVAGGEETSDDASLVLLFRETPPLPSSASSEALSDFVSEGGCAEVSPCVKAKGCNVHAHKCIYTKIINLTIDPSKSIPIGISSGFSPRAESSIPEGKQALSTCICKRVERLTTLSTLCQLLDSTVLRVSFDASVVGGRASRKFSPGLSRSDMSSMTSLSESAADAMDARSGRLMAALFRECDRTELWCQDRSQTVGHVV